MFNNSVRFFLTIVCLVGCVSSADASALTYEFSGTLSQPINGTSQFSGTFTYDTDLSPYPGALATPGWGYYAGVPANSTEPPVSLNFSLGNINYTTAGNISADEVMVAHTTSYDAFYVGEIFNGPASSNLHASIGLVNENLIQQGPFTSTNLPSGLNLGQFSNGASFVVTGTTADGQQVNINASITSLTAIGSESPVPEPGSILVFLLAGAGLVWHRRRSVRRPCAC